MKKMILALAAIMTIGSVALVSCDKENDQTHAAQQQTDTVSLSGTSWTHHHEGTVTYGNYTISVESDYDLIFSTNADGTEHVDATSTMDGHAESSSTDWNFSYTFDGVRDGVLHFDIPDDVPSYVSDNMPERQTFMYDAVAQTITIVTDGDEMVFVRQ